jgi:hypothetical protein
MTTDLKALGLALVAALALGAAAAPAASATDHRFTSNSGNGKTDLTGESEEGSSPTFSAAGIEKICDKGTYAGTVVGNNVGEVTVHPEYDQPCEIPGLSEEADVNTDGCDFRLTGETNVNGDAKVYIECTEGHTITTTDTTFGITTHIKEQGPLTGAHYNNIQEHNGHDAVTVDMTLEGITYSCTGAFCFLLENEGNGNDGTFKDKVIVTGYEDTEAFDMVETTHEWTGEHGDQVDIGVSPGT